MAQPPSLLIEQIDRLFDELVRRRWGTQAKLTPARVREIRGGWEIELDVPDVEPEQLEVEVRGRELTIRGAKKTQTSYHGRLVRFARASHEVAFVRQFLLPEAVPAEAIEARIQDGVLRIRVRRS